MYRNQDWFWVISIVILSNKRSNLVHQGGDLITKEKLLNNIYKWRKIYGVV